MKSYKTILSAIMFFLLTYPAYSYTMRPFNVNSMIQESDVVYKIRVIEVVQDGDYKDDHLNTFIDAQRLVARVKIISEIKGAAPKEIQIAYPKKTQRTLYTELAIGEIAIVFLKRSNNLFKFTDRHNGKMTCVATEVKCEYGDKTNDKILSELIALYKTSTGITRLLSVERLGQLGDIRASKLLKDVSDSPDLALQGMALTSRIRVGDSVKPSVLLEYMSHAPALFGDKKSKSLYHSSKYTISNLNRRIMMALEESVKNDDLRKDIIRSRPTAVLPGFDYIEFFEKASTLRALTNCTRSRRLMASTLRSLADKRSIPLIKRLLDDTDSDVSYLATVTLTRIFKEGPYPSVSLFKANVDRYRSYWKDKIIRVK